MALYHRCHYNSSGRLFDVRLGTDGSAVCDGPNPAQWTGASWNRGAPLGGERSGPLLLFSRSFPASTPLIPATYRNRHWRYAVCELLAINWARTALSANY